MTKGMDRGKRTAHRERGRVRRIRRTKYRSPIGRILLKFEIDLSGLTEACRRARDAMEQFTELSPMIPRLESFLQHPPRIQIPLITDLDLRLSDEALDRLRSSLGAGMVSIAQAQRALTPPTCIGDRTCAHNAWSPNLRCAINPKGPCDECTDYEAINHQPISGG